MNSKFYRSLALILESNVCQVLCLNIPDKRKNTIALRVHCVAWQPKFANSRVLIVRANNARRISEMTENFLHNAKLQIC